MTKILTRIISLIVFTPDLSLKNKHIQTTTIQSH